MENKLITSCKEIPNIPILKFIKNNRDTHNHWCNWCFNDEFDVRKAMPQNLANHKLALAKMKQLNKRGFVSGCFCGCRGDFEITEKGEAFLLNNNGSNNL